MLTAGVLNGLFVLLLEAHGATRNEAARVVTFGGFYATEPVPTMPQLLERFDTLRAEATR